MCATGRDAGVPAAIIAASAGAAIAIVLVIVAVICVIIRRQKKVWLSLHIIGLFYAFCVP